MTLKGLILVLPEWCYFCWCNGLGQCRGDLMTEHPHPVALRAKTDCACWSWPSTGTRLYSRPLGKLSLLLWSGHVLSKRAPPNHFCKPQRLILHPDIQIPVSSGRIHLHLDQSVFWFGGVGEHRKRKSEKEAFFPYCLDPQKSETRLVDWSHVAMMLLMVRF